MRVQLERRTPSDQQQTEADRHSGDAYQRHDAKAELLDRPHRVVIVDSDDNGAVMERETGCNREDREHRSTAPAESSDLSAKTEQTHAIEASLRAVGNQGP